MILLDLNQVMISNLMKQLAMNKQQMDQGLIRHMVLNSIRLYNSRFRNEYGEMVICCDDKNYWRKDYFPYYKAHRKEDRDKSPIDWNQVFDCLNGIRDELKEFFPYKVVQVDRAEADDIIATLTKLHSDGADTGLILENNEKVLIVSGDKDFAQLQKYANVSQYSPVMKKWITCHDPEVFLKEHIMKGDRGDGVPNFLSGDNVIIAKERQRPLAAKKVADWIDKDPADFCNEIMLRNYKRNQQMVDLDFIPDYIVDKIKIEYENANQAPRKGLMNYFIKNKLKHLIEHIGDF